MSHDTHPHARESLRIPLESGRADVDVTGATVELTVSIGGRAGYGIALAADEAARIGEALTAAARAAQAVECADVDLSDVRTVCDLFTRAQAMGVPASVLLEAAGR